MSRTLFIALALAIGVVAGHNLRVPRSLEDVITGQWQDEQEQLAREQLAEPRFDIPRPNISYITQRLDNYNPQNNATFQQRFASKTNFYRAGGPLYVILSSLGAVSGYELDYTLAAQLARSEYGALFILENRYYGQSIPTPNLSVENLQYLTVEQALGDAANFVNHIRTTTPGAADSPVIVLGRAYGGSLAVWFRQKYPHLTAGAWASSAPLLALQNHWQYKVNAAATIREIAGDECYDAIDEGFRGFERIANDGQLAELSELLNVCEEHPLEHDNDVSTLFLLISEILSSISNFTPIIRPFCNSLIENRNGTVNGTEPEVQPTAATALAQTIAYMTGNYCLTVDYEEFIRLENEVELNATLSYVGIRQVTYQLCTQLGWFSTSESDQQPFGSFYPLSFYTEICTRIFGEEIAGHDVAQANQDRFNVEHGGLNPWISNALFTHGSYDPNRSIEVTRDLADSAVSQQIDNAGASYDFWQIAEYNDQALIDAKLDIMAVIRQWSRK